MITNRAILGLTTALFAFASQAGTPKPVDKLELAKSAIQRAEQAGATETAPVELAAAREKLEKSQKLAEKSAGYLAAGRLAEESQADAELAEATARSKKSQNTAAEMDKSLEVLRQESQAARP